MNIMEALLHPIVSIFAPLPALQQHLTPSGRVPGAALRVPLGIARSIANFFALLLGTHILLTIHLYRIIPKATYGYANAQGAQLEGNEDRDGFTYPTHRRLTAARQRLEGPTATLRRAVRERGLQMVQAMQSHGGLAAGLVTYLELAPETPQAVSPIFARLPSEIITLILMYAASPQASASLPSTIAQVSSIHASLLTPRLYQHVLLLTPRSVHLLRRTLALHRPDLGRQIRSIHIKAPHPGALEQILLAIPNLRSLSLSASAHDAFCLSSGSRIFDCATPSLLHLDCVPSPLPVFRKVKHAVLSLRHFDVMTARQVRIALPSLRTIEIWYDLGINDLGPHPWSMGGRPRAGLSTVAEALRVLRSEGKRLEGVTVWANVRIKGALKRRLGSVKDEGRGSYYSILMEPALERQWISVDEDGLERPSLVVARPSIVRTASAAAADELLVDREDEPAPLRILRADRPRAVAGEWSESQLANAWQL
ncbi:hypothetical protein CBOM_02193 [Ceraceosorus bombacis]|uniref:Uncharacterized protein n=1 Tax=Ceraceosorus bombacis TaxID=401625 RepID=A0A0P1BFT5_9BASI|nr:hypothetical protein CBOM_02193 [Ceraceosorus bombacis]